mmetsp:Transcript_20165/g.39146  ORF Transcript_20165/g.39146 Transcript_20165/m.39146 type:complete len:86 (+) Transcript_20165:1580-1837(+)
MTCTPRFYYVALEVLTTFIFRLGLRVCRCFDHYDFEVLITLILRVFNLCIEVMITLIRVLFVVFRCVDDFDFEVQITLISRGFFA